MHVFDSYHSRWFPLFSLFSLICIFWMIFEEAARAAIHRSPPLTAALIAALLGLCIAGSLLLTRTGRPAPLIPPALAFAIFTLAPALPRIIAALAAFAAAAALLLLPSSPGSRPGAPEPETGEPRSEWIAAALTACALLLPPSPIRGAVLLCAGMRFAFGLLFRLLPLRIPVPPNRRLFYRLAWLPAMTAAAAASYSPVYSPALNSSGPTPFINLIFLIVMIICWAAPALRLIVHIDQLCRRLAAWRTLVPPGRRRGLMRSYLIYYGIPLRRRRLRRFYQNHLAPGSRAWDIGAHLGSRTRVWLDLGAQVTAYEPQPVCAAVLENWFGTCPRFRLRPCAAGSRSGSASIHISERHPTLATLSTSWVHRTQSRPRFEGIQWNRQREVPIVRLADEESRFGPPDFIKIDVEGFEPDVIHGLGTMPRSLSFEVLPGEIANALECIEELERRGSWMWNLAVGESFKMIFSAPVHRSTLEAYLAKLTVTHPGGDIYGYNRRQHPS